MTKLKLEEIHSIDGVVGAFQKGFLGWEISRWDVGGKLC